MNAQGRISTRTFPVRTYFGMTSGITVVSNSWQIGHWRSMYSTIVTGANAEPSTRFFCGIPL